MANDATTRVARWGRFERAFTSSIAYENAPQEATLCVTFRGPDGQTRTVDGFWDGGDVWRVRFMPADEGQWSYATHCSDTSNAGLHAQRGSFEVGPASGAGRFATHGPVGLSADRRSLAHADGTPFLWLADTAWNAPLQANADEWGLYLRERVRQGFTTVQWMATQTLSLPNGDRDGQLAFEGHERIAINPAFFQRLDGMQDALNDVGLLSAPVLLWAAEWSDEAINRRNPGFTLPEDQAIVLARYMVARWGANHVAWMLNGDGPYGGAKAARWQRIGRAVFGDGPHAPVMLHPNGMNIAWDEFASEPWLDMTTYQSGHGDDDATLRWLHSGPPSEVWRRDPPRPIINLEPPYEDHLAYHSRQRFNAHAVRRALYWSMLNAPTAGVSYGGHGVWGWDDGSGPPEAHPNTGTARPWRDALHLPAADQIAHLAACFTALPWWHLRPAQELLASQPGEQAAAHHIAAAQTDHSAALIYTPEQQPIVLRAAPRGTASWFDPRTGARTPAQASDGGTSFTPPEPGDWVLLLEHGD
jgi:hypothetical protein